MGFTVIFDLEAEKQEIEAEIIPLDEPSVGLDRIYELIDCSIVERISLDNHIDIWCDEEALYNSSNHITYVGYENQLFSIVGKFCLLSYNGEETVPLTANQVNWVKQNFKYLKKPSFVSK